MSHRLRSLLLLFPMFQLRCVSNGPSGEPAAPTAEFIVVVSNDPASLCLEWTEWRAYLADGGVRSLPRRLRSLLLLCLMFQLRCVSGGPSWERASPIAEFILVISKVAA